mgnify:CR=1 FL=1
MANTPEEQLEDDWEDLEDEDWDEFQDQLIMFPTAGVHDDLVDAMTLALMRFRQGGFIRLESDEPDEPRFFKRRTYAYY